MKKIRLKSVLCALTVLVMSSSGLSVHAEQPAYKTYSKTVAGKAVNVAEIPKGSMSGYIAIGQNKVGGVQPMSAMAKAFSAKVAVNGTFFNAYEKQGPFLPNGNLINKGELIHKYDNGTSFTITKDGSAQIGRIKTSISATAHDTQHTVGVYGINRKVGAQGIYLYTDRWGKNLGIKSGINIMVDRDGKVIKKVSGEDAEIPQGGFVLNVSGSSSALSRFASACSEGSTVSWKYEVSGLDNNDLMLAVGAGPMVLKNSQKITDMQSYKDEGFTEAKILSNAGARSAIGIKANGNIIIATTTAKVSELAGIMLSLGCTDAMNLDGGASSGLYANGRFISSPGRNLSNILYFK